MEKMKKNIYNENFRAEIKLNLCESLSVFVWGKTKKNGMFSLPVFKDEIIIVMLLYVIPLTSNFY